MDIKYTEWRPWFAWRPVKTEYTNEWIWGKRIYRRFSWAFLKKYGHFEYGTEFDLLKLIS